jgi:hypothetical protein
VATCVMLTIWTDVLNFVDKLSALTCGYALDGLGFYYIPFEHKSKPKGEVTATVVKVTRGVLSEAQVISELQRMVSSKWNGEVV